MRRLHGLGVSLAIVLALAVAPRGQALAADFTLNVPVTLTNLHPSVTSALLRCVVSNQGPGGAHFAATNQVGAGQVVLPVRDRGYRGTPTLEINAGLRNPAESARSYACNLLLNGTIRGISYQTDGGGLLAASYERMTGHRLTETVVVIEGPIPR